MGGLNQGQRQLRRRHTDGARFVRRQAWFCVFTPPPAPTNPNAIDAIQVPATAAAGKAFYVDSTGTVRAVAPEGSPANVAHFPLQAGEEISFAVSPDGTPILAVINQEVGEGDGWRDWVYAAVVGSQVQVLRGPLVSSSVLRL